MSKQLQKEEKNKSSKRTFFCITNKLIMFTNSIGYRVISGVI